MRSNRSKQDTIKANRDAAERGHNMGFFRPLDNQGMDLSRCQYWDNAGDEWGAYGTAFDFDCPYQGIRTNPIGFGA
jgi:hypothetical protein